MAAELVGEASLSAFLQVLINGLASSEVLDLFNGKEVTHLGELKTTCPLLNDAEKKLIKDQKVKKWLDELKEAVYDADDLVYKIKTEAILRKKREGKSQSSFTSKVLTKLVRTTTITALDKAIKPEIEEILEKLKSLLDHGKDNLCLENVETNLPEKYLAHPSVEKSDVYGRDDVKNAIIHELLQSDGASNEKLSVIPIVGIGGIGKTTLAHLVYNDERVNERFNTKAWVTVGEDKVDCLKVMKIIIEKLTSEKCEIEEQLDLQDKLKEALSTKKFLFVLDDMWDGDSKKWDILRSSFESGLPGSKIIVTTRSKAFASLVKTGSIHYLEGLSSDDGWELFAKQSLINVDSDLIEIGRKIVNKCKGLPLAIKSLGGLLCGKENEKEWLSSILNNEIWDLCERSSIGIHPALWLSYHYLPSHLKQCFAYCALFPKDFQFKKEKIILLWIAEGLLNGEKMEEVGEEYFKDLISRSFFQPSSEDQLTLVMHDLMHDLAIFISGEFCFMMDDTNSFDHARKIRHLSCKGCHNPRKFEGLSEAKGLRTLLALPLSNSYGIWSSDKKQFLMPVEYLLRSLLSTGTCLRVLSLSQHYITKLPDSIGDLKYLRYLDLSHTEIEEIPDTVCNLYNLQTLLLEGCTRLIRLPTNIGSLVNLRYLHTPPYLQEMPLQLGKMTSLQALSEFVVGKNASSGVKLLKELQHLHGTLHISGLENVPKDGDVLEAELLKDKKFHELILGWGFSHAVNDSEAQKEIDVLGALKPHTDLKKLDIHNYQDSLFPQWVGDHSYKDVVTVRLFNCKKCTLLPPLGQLPSLKHLLIQGFHSVQRINPEFYSSSAGTEPLFASLETLLIKEMPNLQEGLFNKGEVKGSVFPCLKELELRDCPNLKLSLPDYLPSMRKLVIYDCNQLKPLFQTADQQNTAFQSLETMSVSECDGQESLLQGGLPSSLKKIIIFGCENLATLDEEAFQQLTSLEKLEISYCVTLERLPKELPTSLSNLRIHNCPLLTPRIQRETGVDWHIIEKIKNLDIRSRGL